MASSLDPAAVAPGRAQAEARPGLSLTDLLLLCTCIVWGVNYTVVKYGTTVMDPLAYNGARVALAALAFGGLALWRGSPRPARRDALALLLLGVLGNGVYQWLFAEGVARSRAGSAALLLSSSPALIALIGRVMGVERVGARGYAGVALSISGIGLVVYGGARHAGGQSTLQGSLMLLAGALCWALYTVLLKPYTHRVSLVDISALTLVGGAVPLALAAVPAMAATPWPRVPPLAYGAIAYSGIGSLVLGYLFWYRGVRVLGPTRTAIFSNLQPIVALLVSWWLLAEVPTSWQVVGACTIIGGVVLTRT
jgi:drug/metabolite transporter (DMT)-like permease